MNHLLESPKYKMRILSLPCCVLSSLSFPLTCRRVWKPQRGPSLFQAFHDGKSFSSMLSRQPRNKILNRCRTVFLLKEIYRPSHPLQGIYLKVYCQEKHSTLFEGLKYLINRRGWLLDTYLEAPYSVSSCSCEGSSSPIAARAASARPAAPSNREA